MIDKQQVKVHFSKNAANYNEYANVQKKMSDTLVQFLLESTKDTLKVRKILEIGCGTGYLTRSLIELFPSAHITAVDIAPGMISEIKSKLHKNSNIDFICGDIEEIELDSTYDIIISNATFQWFNDAQLTIKKLYNKLSSEGTLCFSTFGSKTFCELSECFEKARQVQSIKDLIYSGQSFYSLNELTSLCKSSWNRESNSIEPSVQSKDSLEYEYFDDCKDFFHSIKKIGANNSNRENRCASPAFIKKVLALYNENFRENNKVKVTYHCVFCKLTYNL